MKLKTAFLTNPWQIIWAEKNPARRSKCRGDGSAGMGSGIGGVARVMYLGETKALEMSWPAPRTGAEELPAGAGPSAFKHGVSNVGCRAMPRALLRKTWATH